MKITVLLHHNDELRLYSKPKPVNILLIKSMYTFEIGFF